MGRGRNQRDQRGPPRTAQRKENGKRRPTKKKVREGGLFAGEVEKSEKPGKKCEGLHRIKTRGAEKFHDTQAEYGKSKREKNILK